MTYATCRCRPMLFLVAMLVLGTADAYAEPITIATVPVGNAGNAPDPATGNLYGGVSYDYRIGTYEVTNAQYVAFLNAVAVSDPFALYDPRMASDGYGGFSVVGPTWRTLTQRSPAWRTSRSIS